MPERYAIESSEHAQAGTVYTLWDQAAGVSASAAPKRGFIWSSLGLRHPNLGPVELLHQGSGFGRPDQLDGMSPVLFPVVGRLRRGEDSGVYVYGARKYQMDVHGFAKDRPWGHVQADADHQGAFVRACLSDDADTRRSYPFAFEYELTYRLLEGALHVEVAIHSEGPFSVGFHPFFNTPFVPGLGKKTDCALRIPARRYWLLENLVPTREVQELNENYDLPEGVDCGQLDIDQVFTDLATDQRGVHRSSLWDRASGIRIDVESALEPFPEIVVCSPRDKPFVCIENWTDPPNILNWEETWTSRCPSSLEGRIRIKPSVLSE